MKARRRITVSSLGLGPYRTFGGQPVPHGADAVDAMKKHWQQWLDVVLPDKPDLIVVPEACDRFPEHSLEERLAYYTYRGDQMRDFFADVAKKNNCYIAYSAARKLEDGTYRNSTQLLDRSGNVAGIYNKNHVVPSETTKGGILAGKDAPVIETDFGRVCMAICFDLNFHELLEKYAVQRPDLIIFSSMYHGGLMQGYWAYHCRSYFVGSIAGTQNNIINPLGDTVAHSTNYYPWVSSSVNLDYQVVHLDENWGKLHALRKKYGPLVNVYDPGYVGAVLVSSDHESITSEDMIKEFDMELWDHYYDRSMQHRHTPGNMEP